MNLLIIIVILIILVIFFYLAFKKDKNSSNLNRPQELSIQYLIEGVRETFNIILNTDAAQWNLNKTETLKREKRRAALRKALRNCSYGDIGAKEYIKEYIKDLIQLKYQVNEKNINQIIPFQEYNLLTLQDKFDILLYSYKKEYGMGALETFIEKYNQHISDRDEKIGYEMREEHIERAYMNEIGTLGYIDKLEIVTQRIYQLYKGHGAIDEIRDMAIDGVSGGVSGISNIFYHFSEDMFSEEFVVPPNAYDGIWIFFQGKTVHMSFLSFGSQKELERVCKNIYRYDNPGHLSAAKGYIVNEMKDGSRVIVVRPPFAENWAFFVRKFDSIKKVNIEALITDKESHIPIETMKWLIKGCQVMAITGEQGCGKTTLLKTLVEFINPIFTLRIQELIFELNLRKLYPYRNILSFKETATVSGQDALDIQKKTDGAVTILGEVASAPVARWLVQLSQVASKFTLFTHHAKTTEGLVIYLRNALLQEGGFTNEIIAEEQVVDTVKFDIHMIKTPEGHRCIERITEILPIADEDFDSDNLRENMCEYYKKKNRKHRFQTVDIVVLEGGKYRLKNKPSKRVMKAMYYNLTEKEQAECNSFFASF
ncbi:MAG: ATPase, T2SS/T4P/T4SS family [Anaerocolumna aminovalerica]|jgi:pilus assembly protein CpaF|uniref:ATPase, T2SS/T4P/T4SS family n=1 Tax=Anaerocolumna aminovalerica TaxID=1527 RepID=UPI001142475B|nr:ATPase, T2SS/T4P/T4SS family [Anaerocolumna aminovalerica]MDU6264534.1 ATPase, T2SS/T4P/T4SS family [Anaerocolumna aminovalerica]